MVPISRAQGGGPSPEPTISEHTVLGASYVEYILYVYKYIHTYTVYVLWSYYLGQVWPFEGLLSGRSLCFKSTVCRKQCKIWGFSPFFEKKNCAQKYQGVIIWAKLGMLCCTKLSPDNNPYLARIITPQDGILLPFLFSF